MILAGIVDLIRRPHRNGGINNLFVVGDEVNPLLILGHGNGPFAELVHDSICIVCFALEDTRICVVRFLNFSNNDGFQLTTGAFEIEMGL